MNKALNGWLGYTLVAVFCIVFTVWGYGLV